MSTKRKKRAVKSGRARSSKAERRLDKADVVGSSPAAPTTPRQLVADWRFVADLLQRIPSASGQVHSLRACADALERALNRPIEREKIKSTWRACHECQVLRGGKVPKFGHDGVTAGMGVCNLCGQRKALIPSSDYDWPDKRAIFD